MIVRTHAALGVLHACVLYFCICTFSAQLSMFHMERRSRNTLIVIIIIIIATCLGEIASLICNVCQYSNKCLCICGATRGVTVSTSAFLPCHQGYCAVSSLA